MSVFEAYAFIIVSFEVCPLLILYHCYMYVCILSPLMFCIFCYLSLSLSLSLSSLFSVSYSGWGALGFPTPNSVPPPLQASLYTLYYFPTPQVLLRNSDSV